MVINSFCSSVPFFDLCFRGRGTLVLGRILDILPVPHDGLDDAVVPKQGCRYNGRDHEQRELEVLQDQRLEERST